LHQTTGKMTVQLREQLPGNIFKQHKKSLYASLLRRCRTAGTAKPPGRHKFLQGRRCVTALRIR
ncbi:hypothetical protein, partial [Atlantibacter hermannii]|uniref:hypothetical protein n=1 Tax=Atlantibacter hermannii TaxID=565 RepID=UPI00289E4D70